MAIRPRTRPVSASRPWLSLLGFRQKPMGLRAIVEAMALGTRNMIGTAVLLVAVGIIVNVLGTTGIGNTFSLMIKDWAQDSLFISIVLVALASLVLGMGLPVTAAYIVLGTLSAPALYDLIVQGNLIDAFASGTAPEQARSILMLVAPDAANLLGQPMPREAAAALVAQIPPDMKEMVLQSTLDATAITAALLSAHMIIFWLSQDSKRHAAGLPGCVRRRGHCANSADGNRRDGLENRQGTLYRAALVCLHAIPGRRSHRRLRHLCLWYPPEYTS